MSLEGNWEQVSGENREKILEALDVQKEFLEKVEGGPKLRVSVSRAGGGGWSWEVTIGEMKVTTLMRVGEAHPVGAHAPKYRAKPTNVSDNVIEEDIMDLEGIKHGTIKTDVNGDQMTTVTTVKGIQSSATFKRA